MPTDLGIDYTSSAGPMLQGDVVAWPTNLGWMMGPWLIYAALLNGASIALFEAAHSCSSPICCHVLEGELFLVASRPCALSRGEKCLIYPRYENLEVSCHQKIKKVRACF